MATAPRGSVLLVDVTDVDAVAASLSRVLPGVAVHARRGPCSMELLDDLPRPVTIVAAGAAAAAAVGVALDPPDGVGGVVAHEPGDDADGPPGRFKVPLTVTVGRDSPADVRDVARRLRARGATTDLTVGTGRPSLADPEALVAAIRRVHPE